MELETKICDECGAEYERGKGVSEDDSRRVLLTERFCSDGCRIDYLAEIEGARTDQFVTTQNAQRGNRAKCYEM